MSLNIGFMLHRRTGLLLLLLLLLPVITAAQGNDTGDTTGRARPENEGVNDNPLNPINPSRIGVGAPKVQTFDALQSSPMGRVANGTLGATVGGAQDIGYARQTINGGGVPASIAFSAEGLFSEHDIPGPDVVCNDKLCLSLGYGYAPTIDNMSNALLVQLSMGSNIRADEFRRLPQQLAIVVDRSGSMSGGNMTSVKKALEQLMRKLGPDDRVVVVQFNDQAQIILGPTSGNDTAAILRAIDSLHPRGGTNIERGMTMGYDALEAMPVTEGMARRMLLFTDAIPNVGRTDSLSFRLLTERYASQGIGLTAFGVGVDFGYELVYHISQLRGCNFFFLESHQKIEHVFDSEFDYMVTPLLYDLDVRIKTPQGLKLTAVYGLPTWKSGDRDAVLHVPTVFLSSNRGAIILRYERDGEGELAFAQGDLLASGTLSYVDVDMSRHSTQTELRQDGAGRLAPGTQFYTHDGMRLAAALTNVYFGLRDGCALYAEGKHNEAIDAVSRARAVATIENLVLSNEGLATEIALLGQLQENMKSQVAVH